ncbi:leucine--tRNA ligase [Chitinophaga sp. GCM10012297]|uniref:Leucine--tRNA ligase n=1 Tax=Chitinophaga chungangae TaxID=2821488 RepID=A0ABS3YCM8_9BACT|nr:leucine--tRNA ligase [Chitinophaga chungangae]MBO9152436.1 leucine--tRNA ligase [Chitinophaga chungangae]
MEYNFRQIERKWQEHWVKTGAYKVSNNSSKPKCYVLDMFPYPSGAGLHVGHPLGYIASDIYARFKRLKGFNVLHPMGYDAFGLPAEQYALETGQHPAVTTEANINSFRSQLDNIGFCFDWDREFRTSDPSYYKWTQYIFLQLFNAWYNRHANKAEPVETLVRIFEADGNAHHECPGDRQIRFNADEWNQFSYERQQEILMEYRLAYLAYAEVNWCPALGTVLANDEVVNGVSERGGHPVIKKKMRQWFLRITEYADRLLEGLEKVSYSEAMKDMQRNWIGKSQGAEIKFNIAGSLDDIVVYTTRPDTIFGVDFMVIAPEHELVERITTSEQHEAIAAYKEYVQSRSERERMAEVKQITGCFTGAYAVNPFDGRKIPIWTSEYVLAGYGTGAIMAVPCGDQRDFSFAKHFNIPITNILGDAFNGEEANPTKEGKLFNSDFITGVEMKEAMNLVVDKIENLGIGKRQINFRMRDAGFSRQRYWGEPFPILYRNGIPEALPEDQLPLELPHVENYRPGEEGEGPLANVTDWVNLPAAAGTSLRRETNTMPGYAGSSWYFLRYMDPHNDQAFCDRKISDYWGQVDLYIGGTEHAVGHLLYSRMWTKALFDLGFIGFDEPYKKLVNQGMITGSSRLVYRVRGTNQYVSAGLKDKYDTDELHVDVNIVDGVELDTEAFRQWRADYSNAQFILEDGKYICGTLSEKMSKSKFNTVNPDMLVDKFGADTFRMYEMFLGPVEQSKPWETKGIEGVHRFLKKFWRLFMDEQKGLIVKTGEPTADELKTLHKTIRKIEEDTERMSYNTAVSAFMVCVNELTDLKCNKKAVLEQMLVLLTPYAPHVCEELWQAIGNSGSVLDASFPVFEEKYVVESTKEYPVSVNGKLRTTINISLDASTEEVHQIALSNEVIQKWTDGQTIKKIIFVPGKMINVVI